MITRKQQSLTLGDTWNITVWEANWDASSMPDQIREQARKNRSAANGSANLDLLSFHEFIYPWLFAYSTGNVPSLEEAFALPDEVLDDWFEAIRLTNPDLFPEQLSPPTIVTFRDNTTITITSSRLPSTLRRLQHLDNWAYIFLMEHPEEVAEFARMKVYAKLACCCTGDVPSYEEATKNWPATELQKWYESVLRANPNLFLTEEEELDQSMKDWEAEQAKKNSAPGKSSNTSRASSRRKVQTSQQ